jgi:hypothetical protein
VAISPACRQTGENKTVSAALKPNWKTELEFTHVTQHYAKHMLAAVILFF